MRNFLMASVASLGMIAGAAAAHAQAAKPVAPGTVVVHLNGDLKFQMDAFGSSVNTFDGYKLNPITTTGHFRLFPGFDGMTTNGIEYGAAAEIRQDTSNPGQGINENSTTSQGTSSLVVRRAYGYIGTAEAGIVRLGQGDSAFGLLQDGVIESFGDGDQWNSDGGIGSIVPGDAHPTWLFADTGALYATSKIVYLSPSFAGINFGVGFEPNSNGINEGIANCATAALTCGDLSSAPGGAGNTRRKNTLDAMVQYTLLSDGVGFKGSVGYLTAAPVGNSSGAPIATITSPQTGAKTVETAYKTLGVLQAGAQVSFAGLTVGANVKTGQVNNGYSFLLPGQRNAVDYIVSASYVMGPALVGGYYFNNQSAGAYTAGSTLGRTEHDNGIAVGGNYAVTPSLGLFVTYLYGERHQVNNHSFGTLSGNAHSNAIGAGADFHW